MKKVFNINEVNKLINKLSSYYTLNEYDVYNKDAVKFIKRFIKLNHAINDINKILTEKDFNDLIKKFFPLKFASLEGLNFRTKKICYLYEDEKVHWIVYVDDKERHFKLKTNDIYSRIESYINPWFDKIKKEIDKLYGYWFEQNSEGWFITDMNKNKDGSYRVVAEGHGNFISSKSFGSIESLEDLHIME